MILHIVTSQYDDIHLMYRILGIIWESQDDRYRQRWFTVGSRVCELKISGQGRRSFTYRSKE